MTFAEVLLLIQERKEITLAQETRFIITNKHRYLRQIDEPENAWKEDTELGAPEKHYGRGGEIWSWKRAEG